MLAGTGKEEVHLVVVATADRGLCGGFNSTIVRGARRHIHDLLGSGKTVKIICIGRKGRDQLRREFSDHIVEAFDFGGVRRLTFEYVAPIALKITEMFDAGEFDVCTVFFNRFQSVITQVLTHQRLIPAEIPAIEEVESESSGTYFEYEPGEDEILEDLLPRNLAVQIYRSLLENAASEQGARMSAMDSATRNAGDMIDRLTLNYNRARQAMITNELIEIISGAEAL